MSIHHGLDDERDRHDQRTAMLRVFGTTTLAFLTLLIVALLVRPDMMHTAMDTIASVMR